MEELDCWFPGSKIEALEKIKSAPDGTYLIRKSESLQNTLALSIKTTDDIITYVIEIKLNGFKIQDDDFVFKSIPELVKSVANLKIPYKVWEQSSAKPVINTNTDYYSISPLLSLSDSLSSSSKSKYKKFEKTVTAKSESPTVKTNIITKNNEDITIKTSPQVSKSEDVTIKNTNLMQIESLIPVNSKAPQTEKTENKNTIKRVASVDLVQTNNKPIDPSLISYDKEKELGKGSFGAVYQGTYTGITVAVKVLHTVDLTQFVKEIQILCSIKHPHCVLCLGWTQSPKPAMIMEWVPNGTLTSLLRNKTLTFNEHKQMAKEAVSGLNYLHSQNVLHRDLKSLNILVGENYHLKITDFGCSKFIDSLQMQNTLVGTPFYIAPEIINNNCEYSEKSDVYALGIVLWEIFENNSLPFVTEHPSFANSNAIATILAIHKNEYRPHFNNTKNPALRKLISQLWDANPANRLLTGQILKQLETISVN